MTFEEARQLIERSHSDYHDFGGARYNSFVIDGSYSLQELEALLVLARHASDGRPEVAA